MKQSDDENTITLDDGRVFEAKKQKPHNFCNWCSFLTESENVCCEIKCTPKERKDGQKVYFKEVKNVKTEKEI